MKQVFGTFVWVFTLAGVASAQQERPGPRESSRVPIRLEPKSQIPTR
jgi:hypothetical protein